MKRVPFVFLVAKLLRRIRGKRDACYPGQSAFHSDLLEPRLMLSAFSLQIMPLGDSITAGAYPWGQASGGYRLGLYQDLKADGVTFNYVGSQIDTLSQPLIAAGETHYEGHPGYRADELAANLLDIDVNHSGNNGGHWLDGTGTRGAVYPNIILVEAGTNDVLERDSASEVTAHISNLIDILARARPHADILVGSLLPIDEPQFLPVVQQVNASIQSTIVPEFQHEGFPVTFVDQYKNFMDGRGNVISSLLYDHIHPVASGYTAMASTWAAAITSVLSHQIAPIPAPTPTRSPVSTTFSAAADAYVRNGSFANVNYGSAAQLLVKQAVSPYDRIAYVTFNLSGLSGTTISKATLRLFGGLQGGSDPTFKINLLAVPTTSWSESALTFKNAPATGSVLASSIISSATSQWYSFNLTSYVQQQVLAGHTSVSFAIEGTVNTSVTAAFNSRYAMSNAPQLGVTQ